MTSSAVSPYKLDVVVATTLASLNSQFKNYLQRQTKSEIVSVCVFQPDAAVPESQHEISLASLISSTGVNPFNIPAGTDAAKSSDVQALARANFFWGMRGQLAVGAGFKGGVAMELIRIAQSTTDKTSRIQFAPVWKTLEVVSLSRDKNGVTLQWNHLSKPSKADWVVSIDVPFKMETRLGYERWQQDTMTGATTAMMDRLGSKYGWGNVRVNRLLLDMAKADVNWIDVNQVQPWAGLTTVVFVAMKLSVRVLMQKLDPNLFVLGFVVTLPSVIMPSVIMNPAIPNAFIIPPTVRLSSFKACVQPRQSNDKNDQLATIDYQCVANDLPQPPPQRFTWDWVPKQSDSQDHHGVVSTSRQTMAYYLHKQLDKFAMENSMLPKVYLAVNGYEFKLGMSGGETSDEERPATGPTLLKYKCYREAYDDGGFLDSTKLQARTNWNMSVDFSGSDLTITQQRTISIGATHMTSIRSGNILAKQRKDKYSFVIDPETGKIVHGTLDKTTNTFTHGTTSTELSTIGDESALNQNDDISKATDLNDALKIMANMAPLRDPAARDVFDMDFLDSIAFPGANTFAFTSPQFAPSGDFIAYVNYEAPPKATI